MKKVLVTGATGFIGHHIINRLLEESYHVIGTSATIEKARSFDWFGKIDFRPFNLGDVSDSENYFEYFDRPDVLIHLAWEGLPNYKEPFHLSENLPRHFAFLKNLVVNGLKNITVTGTCFEYGKKEGCLSEEMPSAPENAYAAAKDNLRVALERLGYQYPFDLKWVRLFYMYGEGQGPNSLLSQLQSAINRGESVFNMSPGDQLRDYLPVTTVADYIVRIAMQKKITGIINCCSGIPVSVESLVRDYLAETGASIKLNLGYYPYSDIEPKNFWGDNRKLKSILGDGEQD